MCVLVPFSLFSNRKLIYLVLQHTLVRIFHLTTLKPTLRDGLPLVFHAVLGELVIANMLSSFRSLTHSLTFSLSLSLSFFLYTYSMRLSIR